LQSHDDDLVGLLDAASRPHVGDTTFPKQALALPSHSSFRVTQVLQFRRRVWFELYTLE
jgi:hypothetical protein